MLTKNPWLKRLQNLLKQKETSSLDPIFWEELEDLLLEGDLSLPLTQEILSKLKTLQADLSDPAILKETLKAELRPYLLATPLPYETGKMNLYFILGINGVGKTTTLAKLARWFQRLGHKDIVFCAGDTFRAGASEQLKQHARALDIRCIAQKEGADPSSVLWDTLASAKVRKESIILIDTAGRLHNKAHLMEELKKMSAVSGKVLVDTPFIQHNLLIIDAHMGQNALQQAKIFSEALVLSGFILTKFDSTSRSGVVVSISNTTRLPFMALGEGETREDLCAFDIDRYLDKLLTL